MHTFKLQKSCNFKKIIDDTAIDFYFFRNFASVEDIRRRCNPIVDLSKFTSSKKIWNKVVTLGYN